ncbi:MAG: reverse transcriptase family protein [Actinomycetota bacterium]
MSSAMRFGVAELDTARDLADLVGMRPTDLVRYVDARSFERTAPIDAMRNHRYRWHRSRSGSLRLIEAPKPILAHLQRTVSREVLVPVPTHDAAHGFVRGRSPLTAARPHVGADVLIRLDLEAFFTTVPVGRVHALFRSCGYSNDVSHRLTGLVTNATPLDVLRRSPTPSPGGVERHRRVLARLTHPHLAQGAPTSPLVANLVAWRLDARLTGLASAFDAVYTRYADDLAFSGGDALRRRSGRLIDAISAIAADEGFVIHPGKTRVATRGQRQQFAGIVVNERLNVDRRDVDRLRAELHDAVHHGIDVANRSGQHDYRNHLLGRIAWVTAVNPARGERLRRSFDQIDWSAD